MKYNEEKAQWYRICPFCKNEIYHKSKSSCQVCERRSRSCLQCLPKLVKCTICGKHGHTKRFHDVIPTEKVCSLCKHNLPIENFYYRNKKRKNGKLNYSPYCKTCEQKKYNERFNSSPERRAIILWNSAKSRCKKENVPFSISVEDIINQYKLQNGKCFYSEQLMSPIAKSPTKMSIDRIDSSKGYTNENIVLCTWRINEMKNNDSQESFISMCNQISRFSNDRKF